MNINKSYEDCSRLVEIFSAVNWNYIKKIAKFFARRAKKAAKDFVTNKRQEDFAKKIKSCVTSSTDIENKEESPWKRLKMKVNLFGMLMKLTICAVFNFGELISQKRRAVRILIVQKCRLIGSPGHLVTQLHLWTWLLAIFFLSNIVICW